MELFGIVFSVPFVFVASMGWCALLEVGLLIGLGPRGSYRVIGWGFYGLHLVNFVYGAPALANVLVLRTKPDFVRRWWVAGFLCAAFGVGLVLLQVEVSEALFGVNGDESPFD